MIIKHISLLHHTHILFFIVGPVITVNPVSINVTIEVENITLNCTARGFPVPSITWAHNGSLITSTEDEIFIYTLPTSYLRTVQSIIVINAAMANNTGDYKCIASSPFYDSVNSTVALVLVQGNVCVYSCVCTVHAYTCSSAYGGWGRSGQPWHLNK